MLASSIILRIAGEAEARRKLGEILARREFQGWINPLDDIRRALLWLADRFSGLPAWAQIAIAAVLVLILLAVFIHWGMVLRRFVSSRGIQPDRAPRGGLDEILRSNLPPEELRARALAALGEGDFREAVRLLYACFVLGLRGRGMIPAARSLTGREIARIVGASVPRSEKATALFEMSAYSRHPLSGDEAGWMLDFVEEFERTAPGRG
jgi:hypothetical protein